MTEASRAHCPNADPRVRRRDGVDPPRARACAHRQGGLEAAPEVDAARSARDAARRAAQLGRSEEHTSELQSQSNLVCRLLLEKKNSASHALTPIEPSALFYRWVVWRTSLVRYTCTSYMSIIFLDSAYCPTSACVLDCLFSRLA